MLPWRVEMLPWAVGDATMECYRETTGDASMAGGDATMGGPRCSHENIEAPTMVLLHWQCRVSVL